MYKVYACVDWMGGGGQTPEEEYDEIEELLTELIGPIRMERDVFPYKLENAAADLYLIDFGGILPGCDGIVQSHFRSLADLIPEMPDTLFIIWSRHTEPWYEEAMQEIAGREIDQPNVLYRSNPAAEDLIKEWFEPKLVNGQGRMKCQ